MKRRQNLGPCSTIAHVEASPVTPSVGFEDLSAPGPVVVT